MSGLPDEAVEAMAEGIRRLYSGTDITSYYAMAQAAAAALPAGVYYSDGQGGVEPGNEIRDALADLVRLKDGPRDDAYRAEKDAAWERARAALSATDTEKTGGDPS